MATPLSPKLDWQLANPIWAQALNPIIASPLSSAKIIQHKTLISGVNIINHGLNRVMQGWFIVDINGIASIYRSAPLNGTTLTLTSNAVVTVSIGVF